MVPTLPKKKLMGVVAVLTLGLGALFPVLDFYVLTQLTFVVGLVILLPLIAILGEEFPFVESSERADEPTEPTTAATDPLDELRQRYARGELSTEEFERRLERLLETERHTEEATDDAEQIRDVE